MASIVDQQDKFYQEVQQFAENNTSKHNHLYTRDKLNKLISKVKNAKEASKKSDQDRHLLKKYDIIEVADIEKLIKKGGNGKFCFVLYDKYRRGSEIECKQKSIPNPGILID